MRSYRVLIVDDDAVDRRLYGRLLTQPDPDTCDIHHAVTGTAGLAALRAEMFDCVLLDLNLPDMTGLEFLTAAALNGELPCAIVLIAGQGSEATAVEAMKLGAQDYLVKDQVNADSLWRAVRRAVTHAQLNQRLAGSSHDLGPAKLVPKQEAAMGHATEAQFRAAKGAAEHANQAKTRFAAMVAHELRTPLDGILGYAQLLRIQAGLSAWQDAHVGAMMWFAALERPSVRKRVCGQRQDRHAAASGGQRSNAARRLQPVHLRHPHVHQDQVELLFGG
jgi:CheY-like chemotaxis protein